MEKGAWVWGNTFLLEEGKAQHATEKWQSAAGEGGTLCSVHRHVNGTLFMSRQRGRKVTATHARMPRFRTFDHGGAGEGDSLAAKALKRVGKLCFGIE